MKSGGRLPAQSKKRRKANRERSAMVKELWPDGAPCVVPFCGRWAQDPHEPLTRARRGSITDPDNVVPTCRTHNSELTNEPAWGYALDLLIHSWDQRTYAQQAADRAEKLANWEHTLNVHGIAFCAWEQEHLPIDHPCVGAPPACPTKEGEPCGVCASCLSAQAEDLTRHGSPSTSQFDAP